MRLTEWMIVGRLQSLQMTLVTNEWGGVHTNKALIIEPRDNWEAPDEH